MAKAPRKFGADPREEGVTGGPRTTPMNPTRKETLRKAEEENAKNREKTRRTPVPRFAKGGMAEKGSDMMYAKGGKTMKYAKGGSASKRADGIAKKGKTKGMMPKMAKGGKMKGC
jgi:hypothetical protein